MEPPHNHRGGEKRKKDGNVYICKRTPLNILLFTFSSSLTSIINHVLS